MAGIGLSIVEQAALPQDGCSLFFGGDFDVRLALAAYSTIVTWSAAPKGPSARTAR